jgi:hypothetical protein
VHLAHDTSAVREEEKQIVVRLLTNLGGSDFQAGN